jgi:hypothetical protein
MNRMKVCLKLVGSLLLASLIFLMLCSANKKTKPFDYGRIENGKYLNSFFGLEITLPSDWILLTKAQLQNLTEKGKKLLAGDNERMKKIVKAADVDDANLFGVFKYEMGAAVNYNPNLILVAANLKNSPGVKTGDDYLFHARKLLKQSQLYDYIDEECEKEIINNQEFYLMSAYIKAMGLNLKQTYYATVRNGFALMVAISFIDDEEKDNLEKTVKSIKFSE